MAIFNRFLWRCAAIVAALGLSPVSAQAGVMMFNGAQLEYGAFTVPAKDALAALDGDDAAWLQLPALEAREPAVNTVEVPAATELTTPAIVLTALGLVLLAARAKKKEDDGRQSLWGALGSSPPVAGM